MLTLQQLVVQQKKPTVRVLFFIFGLSVNNKSQKLLQKYLNINIKHKKWISFLNNAASLMKYGKGR